MLLRIAPSISKPEDDWQSYEHERQIGLFALWAVFKLEVIATRIRYVYLDWRNKSLVVRNLLDVRHQYNLPGPDIGFELLPFSSIHTCEEYRIATLIGNITEVP